MIPLPPTHFAINVEYASEAVPYLEHMFDRKIYTTWDLVTFVADNPPLPLLLDGMEYIDFKNNQLMFMIGDDDDGT